MIRSTAVMLSLAMLGAATYANAQVWMIGRIAGTVE